MTKQLAVAAVLAVFGASMAFAVTPGADSPTAEGAKGAEQHDRSAQPSGSTTDEKKGGAASTGASTTPPAGDKTSSEKTFTHGESKRCESMTGADKDQCDKEEATKSEGSAAQGDSKKP
jgi:hypothetical protein